MSDEKTVDRRTITLEPLDHQGQRRIALRFAYDGELIAAAKSIGAQWSRTHTCWHVPNGSDSMKAVFAAFKGRAWVNADGLFTHSRAVASGSLTTAISKPPSKEGSKPERGQMNPARPIEQRVLDPAQEAALQRMKQKLEIARYSPRSIQTYINATKQFFLHFSNKHPNDIRTEDIEAYQHHLAAVRKVSNSYLNQVVNAVRYYYKDVLDDRSRVRFIERPRRERKLPSVLSEEEVTAILRSVDNLKHQ